MTDARLLMVRLIALATDRRLASSLRLAAFDAVLPHVADVAFSQPSRAEQWRAEATLARLDAQLAQHPLLHPLDKQRPRWAN